MTTTRAIRFAQTGGPDVLDWQAVGLPAPAAGEVTLRHTAIGLNYIDTYHRSGLYALPLPSGIGLEAAGVVEAVGAGVTEFRIGDRVAYAGGICGAYSERRNLAADVLVPLPDTVSDETAAASMLAGMTAQYLLKRTRPVGAGDTLLWHAAAGGVGQIAVQWARALGATVIGTVGSEDKAAIARSLGCDHVINYREEEFAPRVRELTQGRGVPVVFDSVGAATFEGSLDSLAPRGMLVSFGNASGAVPPVSPNVLAAKGSLYLTRPRLADYTATRAELLETSADLFAVISSGQVRISIGQRYALQDAAQAHRDLEARRTTGSTVLLP